MTQGVSSHEICMLMNFRRMTLLLVIIDEFGYTQREKLTF